jgi:hypothetical protein
VGKYWAVQLLARLSVIIAGLFAFGGLVWIGFTGLALLSVIPLSLMPFGAVLGATAAMGNFVIAITLFFGALMWLVFGQLLLMALEVTEHLRHLKHLKALPLVLRQPDPPWLKDPDEAWSRRA